MYNIMGKILPMWFLFSILAQISPWQLDNTHRERRLLQHDQPSELVPWRQSTHRGEHRRGCLQMFASPRPSVSYPICYVFVGDHPPPPRWRHPGSRSRSMSKSQGDWSWCHVKVLGGRHMHTKCHCTLNISCYLQEKTYRQTDRHTENKSGRSAHLKQQQQTRNVTVTEDL